MQVHKHLFPIYAVNGGTLNLPIRIIFVIFVNKTNETTNGNSRRQEDYLLYGGGV